MPIMEISVVPVGTGTVSVSAYVAHAFRSLKGVEGIKYRLTPMGTIVEANSLNRLLGLAAKMHQAVLECGVERIVTVIKIDDRRDKISSMERKTRSVRTKMKKFVFKRR